METVLINGIEYTIPGDCMADIIAGVRKITIAPRTIRYALDGAAYVGRDVFEHCPTCGGVVLIEVYRDIDETPLAGECECGARINFNGWEM